MVTGAFSGPGVAIAAGLAEAGADVVLGARRLGRLGATEATVRATGRRALSVATDAEPEACEAPASAAVAELGRVDIIRDLAQQWSGRKGIRVNAAAPGFFPPEMTEQYEPGYLERQASRTVLGRLGELAAAVLFLASPASGYFTGQTLVVGGGLTCG